MTIGPNKRSPKNHNMRFKIIGVCALAALTFLTDVNGDGNLTWVVPTSSTFTGGTVSGATNFTGGLTANTISATTITSPSVKTYGLIVATSLGYQNIF
jgi:hypothetical protein